MERSSSRMAVRLAWLQGLYFLLTGAWPLVSVRTFQLVTGKKTDHLVADPPAEADHWMLFTISGLIIAIALVMLAAAWKRRISFDVALVGIASAAALTLIDIVYVARGTIAPIYLLDAAAELVIILSWIWAFVKGGVQRA